MPADVFEGSRWWNLKGEFIDIKNRPFNARGDGSTDDTWAFQQAATTGYPILVPSGTYVITDTIDRITSGESQGLKLHGMGVESTIFDNRIASGALLNLDGSTTLSAYARGLHLSDFSIETTTSPASSRGIDLRSQHGGDIERIRIQGLSSDAIRVTNNNGDQDSTAYIRHKSIHALLNGGWAYNCVNPSVTTNASGGHSFDQCVFDRNTSGGARILGQYYKFTNGFMGASGAGDNAIGLLVPYVASNTLVNLALDNMEFQDCDTYLIDIQAGINISMRNIKLIASSRPDIGVRIGDGGSGVVYLATIEGVYLRRDSGTHTFFQFTSTSNSCNLDGVIANTSTGVTKYTDAGTNNAFTRIVA